MSGLDKSIDGAVWDATFSLGGDYIADATVSLIRHEHIEPQSIAAYQVFVASCLEMYRIGAAVELARLGYKFEKL